MALLASDILTRIRDQHPLFAVQRVPNAILLRSLSTYQSMLIGKAMLRDRTFLMQQASILFTGESASGAGVGGFPVSVGNDGTVSRSRQPTGYVEELVLSGGTTLVSEFVPSSSTTTSVTKTAAGWTTNAYVNAYMEVTAGTGLDQRRAITSNTSTTLSWATPLTTPLDTTSVVRVVSVAASVPSDMGVVTALPATDSRIGYVMKLDSNGVAYIDTTDPLTAVFDTGIPLPDYKHIVGGTVRFSSDPTDWCPLTLTSYAERVNTLGDYIAYVANRQLFLVGDSTDWDSVESIDLRYVPEPIRLTQTTDYFLLPDHAESVLVAHGAFIAGQRVQGLEGMPGPDMALLGSERDRAESAFLSEVAASARGTDQRLREAW